MDSDKQKVIERLRFHERRFTELMKLVENGPLRKAGDKEEARERLKELKAGLAEEAKDLERNSSDLNQFERNFLEPALRKAGANINTRANTNPDGKWHSDLYGARIDISHVLHSLEK